VNEVTLKGLKIDDHGRVELSDEQLKGLEQSFIRSTAGRATNDSCTNEQSCKGSINDSCTNILRCLGSTNGGCQTQNQ
jgi:hypothetical protein